MSTVRYDWDCHLDLKTGKTYYSALTHHTQTSYTRSIGQVQWERPHLDKIKPHWIAYLDLSSGKLYFENIDTKLTRWERPDEFYDAKNKWMAMKDPSAGSQRYYYTNIATQKTQWEIPECFQTKLEKEWRRHYDTDSKQYFYENLNTAITSWDIPKYIKFNENGEQIITNDVKLRRAPIWLDEDDYLQMIYLIEGYFARNIHQFESMLYPIELTNMFIQFIGDIFCRIDVFPDRYKTLIKNKGKLIEKHTSWNSCRFSVACSNGWNNGVHKINVKCTAFGAPPVIGITTNYVKYKEDGYWCGDTKGYVYGYYSPDIMVKNGPLAQSAQIIKGHNLPSLKPGDVVKLIVDIGWGKLSININECQQVVDIQRNKTYYFFISLQSHYCLYELLKFR